VLSAGNGTVSLVWDGTQWIGTKVIGPCTVDFRFTTTCLLQYRCSPSGLWVTAACISSGGTCFTCGPPMVTTAYTFNDSALSGCGCTFGAITGVLGE